MFLTSLLVFHLADCVLHVNIPLVVYVFCLLSAFSTTFASFTYRAFPCIAVSGSILNYRTVLERLATRDMSLTENLRILSLAGNKAEALAVAPADRIADLQVVLLLNVSRSLDPPAWVAASFSKTLSTVLAVGCLVVPVMLC